jgi:hypothetical protein
MIERSSGTLPTRVQILVLAPFLDFPGFTSVMHYVVSDVPVDNEAPSVASGISRSADAQSFGGAHRGRVRVHVFIGMSVRACCERPCCTVFLKKTIYLLEDFSN